MRYQDDEFFEHRGYRFRVEYQLDEDHGAPWEDHDGHGVVSEWTRREKRPGERVLVTDGRYGSPERRYYDIEATLKIARRDQWGPKRDGETAKQTAARAVEEDFKYLQSWCYDEWRYVGVIVVAVDEDGKDTDVATSLWGVETYGNYHETVKTELADELFSQLEVEHPDVVLSEN